MKSKVKLSVFSTVLTAVVIIAIVVGIFTSTRDVKESVILSVILAGMILCGLFYCPASIEAAGDSLLIRRVLKTKRIPYTQIASVDRCYPSAGGLRLCGSGGFMGYWGYFSDIVIGTYFGYYGNHNQCILIRLKNGKQYVVSCCGPDEMVAAIAARCK